MTSMSHCTLLGDGIGCNMYCSGCNMHCHTLCSHFAVIHDWEDEPATAILKTIRRAARPASRLLIAGERLLGYLA